MRMVKKNKFLIISHVILIFISICIVAPFILLIISSLTDDNTAIIYGYSFFPKKWSMDAYSYVFRNWGMFGKAYMVTIGVTVVGVIAGVLIASLMAYTLSNPKVPGVKLLIWYVMFTMMFNGGLVATYFNYVQVIGIKNTYLALIVPGLLCKAFNIILIKNYFAHSVPGELREAAKIDGASEYGIFFKIMFPLSKPILATVALLIGLAYWNDWTNGMYYLDDMSMYGIQNVLNNINKNVQYLMEMGSAGETLPTTTARMAVAVIGMLPVLIIYPFFQGFFTKGIVAGAVKG